MRGRDRLLLLASCWVALPVGVMLVMWSIAIHGHLNNTVEQITIERPGLFAIGACLLLIAAWGTRVVLTRER
jgi:hypothetical protein